MRQLTTPLTNETGHATISEGRAPRAIFRFLLSSVCARLSNHHPILPGTVVVTVIVTGFVAVPYAWGMPITDFAELVGAVVVLYELTRFALRLVVRAQVPPDDVGKNTDVT